MQSNSRKNRRSARTPKHQDLHKHDPGADPRDPPVTPEGAVAPVGRPFKPAKTKAPLPEPNHAPQPEFATPAEPPANVPGKSNPGRTTRPVGRDPFDRSDAPRPWWAVATEMMFKVFCGKLAGAIITFILVYLGLQNFGATAAPAVASAGPWRGFFGQSDSGEELE